MRIAIDFDGVIADIPKSKSEWIRNRLGIHVPPWKTDREKCIPIIGEGFYAEMTEKVYKDIDEAVEVKDAGKSLEELKNDGNLLYFVTSRTQERMQFALEWLKLKQMHSYFDDFYCAADDPSKALFIEKHKIDAIIDDELRFLLGLPEHTIKVLLATGGVSQLNDLHIVEVDVDGRIIISKTLDTMHKEKIRYAPNWNYICKIIRFLKN